MTAPKYKIGDSVWIINTNRTKAIKQVVTIVSQVKDYTFEYGISNEGDYGYEVFFQEDEIFPTKESLINSL